MTHARLKLSLAGVVFVGAIVYLAYSGMQKGWTYTLGVDSYLAKADVQNQRVRLCGRVSEHNLDVRKAQLAANFVLVGEKSSIPVAYHGAVPDLFKAGGEVLVEGQRDAQGVFQADLMMTKCASKYEEAPPGHPVQRPGSADPAQGATQAGGGGAG